MTMRGWLGIAKDLGEFKGEWVYKVKTLGFFVIAASFSAAISPCARPKIAFRSRPLPQPAWLRRLLNSMDAVLAV